MRYLGQFPSEQQIVDFILPKIEEDEPSHYIKYSNFEPYMVNGTYIIKQFSLLLVLMTDDFAPDDTEILMAAFKKLDEEGTGVLELELMESYIT